MRVKIDITGLYKKINGPFLPLLTNKNRYLILRGGAGSGKSVFAAQKLLLRTIVGMSKGYNHRFLVLRKTSPAARKSVYPLLKYYVDTWNLHKICKVNKTDMSFNFVDGSLIMCTGLDDPDKIKSIFDITSVWMEEANEFTIDDFRQLDLRLRGQTDDYYQIMCSFNPISKKSWLYDEFFAAPKEEATCHHSTYKDNKFLDETYQRRLEHLINEDPVYYQVYTLGEWGILEGIIFNNWRLIDDFPKEVEEVVYGVDFGFNSPSSIVKVAEWDEDYYMDEVLYRTKMTNSDLIRWMKRNIPERSLIYADSAEPDRIEEMRSELRKKNIIVKPAKKGRNSVKDGLDYMRRKKLFITKVSDNLIKEIQGYKYKVDKDGNVLDDPVPYNDHALDATRYAIYTHWGRPIKDYKIRWI